MEDMELKHDSGCSVTAQTILSESADVDGDGLCCWLDLGGAGEYAWMSAETSIVTRRVRERMIVRRRLWTAAAAAASAAVGKGGGGYSEGLTLP